MTKSLGQIAHEAGWPECERFLSWEKLIISCRVRNERGAKAVAAHVGAMDAKQAVPPSAYRQVEKALWTAHEWSLLHNGVMHNITIACGSAHAALLAEKQATAQAVGCQDLTDDDIDQIITWQDDCGRGDIGFQGFCDKLIKAFSTQSAATAQAVGCGDAWQPIKTAQKGKTLIVGYLNRGGNWRSVMARYYLPQTLEAADDSHYAADEEGYAPEGWYEESETHESILPTDEPPTHWMPRPTPPQTKQPVGCENAWISVTDRLPECDQREGSFGVEVFIWPPHESESTAFFGKRYQDESGFYKYGTILTGITHWSEVRLPTAPPQPEQLKGQV